MIEIKLCELEQHCGNCDAISWCGQVPFSDTCLCANSIINQLTTKQYVDIASTIDTKAFIAEINLDDPEDDEEFCDKLNKIVELEVIKRLENKKMKPILDVSCGSRMFYFDKSNPLVHFNDIRKIKESLCDGRVLEIDPETQWDFRNLPVDNNTYHLVVFDPPHLVRVGDNSWLAKKYGKLPISWQTYLKQGFDECMRVLKPYGTLIFKWNETDIKQKELFNALGTMPIFGDRGRGNKTYWFVFMKECEIK